MAKKQEAGYLLNLQASAIFYAFAFEAYLNHVGFAEIEIWGEIERLPHARKLRIIAKHLKMQCDMSKPPFQTITALFKLRDTLAHARTMTIDAEYETDEEPQSMESWEIHDWEKLTVKSVTAYSDSVSAAIELINAARPTPDEGLWNHGIRGRSVRWVS